MSERFLQEVSPGGSPEDPPRTETQRVLAVWEDLPDLDEPRHPPADPRPQRALPVLLLRQDLRPKEGLEDPPPDPLWDQTL